LALACWSSSSSSPWIARDYLERLEQVSTFRPIVTYTAIPVAADASGPNKGLKVRKETLDIHCGIYSTSQSANLQISLNVVRYEDPKQGGWEDVLQAIKDSLAGKADENDPPSTKGNSGMSAGTGDNSQASASNLKPSDTDDRTGTDRSDGQSAVLSFASFQQTN
jgi:hypothetical protein